MPASFEELPKIISRQNKIYEERIRQEEMAEFGMNWDDFTKEKKRGFFVRPIFIDMAHDYIAGVLLSQIVYWNLPGGKGKEDCKVDGVSTKLRVIQEDGMWLAKTRADFTKETRLTERQVDRALNILKKENLIFTKVVKFKKMPTTHIQLNLPNFLAEYQFQKLIFKK